VNRKSIPAIPEAILQLQRQLDQFRSTQPRRTKLPESLWQAAVELARQHGVAGCAHCGRVTATLGLPVGNFPRLPGSLGLWRARR
jgi:hypothetical protein